MMTKKIVSFQAAYNLEKKHFSRDVWQIWKTISDLKWYLSEVWVLKKPWQSNFDIEWQKWIWFWNKFIMYLNLFLKSITIDLIQFYHIDRKAFLWTLLYRIFNWRGHIYIKMDTVCFIEDIDFRVVFWNQNKVLLSLFLFLVSSIGFEDDRLYAFFLENFPKFRDKYLMTTNAIVPEDIYIWNLRKTNSISMIWRFWSVQKNNELLLDALEANDVSFLKWWKIYLMWTYTDVFLQKLDSLLKKKPQLIACFVKKWFIVDKNELYKIVSSSKIFLHTANFECDTNIQYDAMFCWCYMVSTDVWNMKQNYLSEYSLFYWIKDSNALFCALKSWLKNAVTLENKDYLAIQSVCLKKFVRNKSLAPLLAKI